MDPQIPTSFIPKRPVVAGVPTTTKQRTRAVGLLSLVTGIVMAATLLSFALVYLYERSLTSQRDKLEQSINEARNGVGTDFLADMKRLTARINGVNMLLNRHIVVTPIFEALQKTTLRSVQYKTFTYEFNSDPNTKTQIVNVQLTGTARNYTTIALQSDAFSQSSLIRNPVFSGLTVDEKGNVGFTLTFDVSPSDLSFVSFITKKNNGVPKPTESAEESTTTTEPAATTTTSTTEPTPQL